MNTTCKCLETIREKLSKHHGESADVELELKQTVDTETLTLGVALPPLYYTYKKGKKRQRSYVHFTFCPFCGKK